MKPATDRSMVAHMSRSAVAGVGLRLILTVVCATAIPGCAPRRAESPPPAPAPGAEATELAIPSGATAYRIDPDRSIVTLRVYRAGRLARLGHNHVITSANETGYAWTSGAPATSGFEMRIAVADLVVDDPVARAAAGPEFPGELTQAAREGTRSNMLRAEVLDGARHPQIVVGADSVGGTWDRPSVAARVTLRGVTRSMDVPLAVVRDDESIVARGVFRVLQSDFGITPFSIGGGAIAVADAVDVSFEIRAVRP